VAWAAVFAVARVELRGRWRAPVVLGLLFGLMGGAVVATATVTRRTDSAYPRLVAATHRADATVPIAAEQSHLVDQVSGLPGVAASWAAGVWVGQVHGGTGLNYLAVVAGSNHPTDLLQPVVLQGRRPHDDAVDEVLVSETYADGFGIGVGSQLALTLLTPDQFTKFDVGFGDPAGPAVRLQVVGVGRLPSWNDFHVIGTPRFASTYGAAVVASYAILRLQPGSAARQEFADALDRLAAANPPSPEIAEFGTLRAVYPAAAEEPLVAPARRIVVGALTGSAIIAGLVALLVITQALARHHTTGEASQRIEAALGMTRAERAAARALTAVPGGLIAGAAGAAIGVAAGLLQPVGALRRFEPEPGYRADFLAVSVGSACLVLLFVLFAVITAAAVLRGIAPLTAPTATARVWLGWRSAGLRAGWCLAIGGGRRSRTATTAAALGSAVGVAAIVAAVTFGVSLDRLVAAPSRYGWTADLTLIDAKDGDIARLVADDRVAALAVVTSAETLVATELIKVSAFEPRKGTVGPQVITGRLPSTPGETAVGQRLAARLDLNLGDDLALTQVNGTPVRLRVVGFVVVRPSEFDERLGMGIVVHPDAVIPLIGTPQLREADILAAEGQTAALIESMRNLEIHPRDVPPEITAMADIRLLPDVLALVVGGAVVAGILHALRTTRRRHRREFAVLRAIGFTDGQVFAARVVLALALVVPALAIGLLVGAGAARLIWYETAVASGVAGDTLVPAGWLVIGAAMALLGTVLAALVPRKSAEPIAATLRSE
jgi:putative ABC transport system permease protein